MMKYLGINSTKYIQKLYTENYNILLREIKEYLKINEDKLCSWIRIFNIVKVSVFSKFTFTILIKISGFFLQKLIN